MRDVDLVQLAARAELRVVLLEVLAHGLEDVVDRQVDVERVGLAAAVLRDPGGEDLPFGSQVLRLGEDQVDAPALDVIGRGLDHRDLHLLQLLELLREDRAREPARDDRVGLVGDGLLPGGLNALRRALGVDLLDRPAERLRRVAQVLVQRRARGHAAVDEVDPLPRGDRLADRLADGDLGRALRPLGGELVGRAEVAASMTRCYRRSTSCRCCRCCRRQSPPPRRWRAAQKGPRAELVATSG